jgi:hypothetical protein
MPTGLLEQLLWIAILAVCALAYFRGGSAERWGGVLTLSLALAFQAVNVWVPEAQRSVPHLVLDGMLAVGFMVLALRYASAWLGLVMVLQGVQFSLHAFYFVTQKTPRLAYAIINNLVTWGTLLGILWGVLAYWRQQRRANAL